MGRKHSHYFKDVVDLDEIDVYRVCDIFGINDSSGATQHALKKLLLPGQRGAGKDLLKDYQEAVDTLNRRIEMLKEDELSGKRILGLPFTVANELNACTSIDQVQQLKLKGATSVRITHEFYRSIRDLG